jgi:glycerol-3-phosphate dehydrogenase
VVWAARHEMVMWIEDFLSRRSRALLLDARASIEMAPQVAELMARELGHDDALKSSQVEAYCKFAERYIV